MPNLVLYRKYRPKTFGEVVGQEHIVQTLKNAVQQDLVSHAYLFSGPRGSGKTTLARILAKSINCSAPKNGEPCNTCASCLEIGQGKSLDFVEIDAASNRGIDEIRDLKEGIRFGPTTLKYKVFVVDEAHQLTKEAANALLKTLEEPPPHAVFVLATTEVHRMIPTIVSRCQRFEFRRLTFKEILEALSDIAKKEGATLNQEALRILAGRAGGSLRDAESLLDRVLTFYAGKKEEIDETKVQELLGIVPLNTVAEFVDLLLQKNAANAVEFLNKNLEAGMDPVEFAKNLLEYLRRLAILKINPNLKEAVSAALSTEQQNKAAQQAEDAEMQFLASSIKEFMAAERDMRNADIVQLPLELAIVETCAASAP